MNRDSSSSTKINQEPLARTLADFVSGTLTISVNNFPFVRIDAESKTVQVEVKGFLESGLHLRDLGASSEKGFLVKLRQSSSLAQNLYKDGWSLRVFEGRDSLLAMGKGVTPLTGFVWLNPLKLNKIFSLI